MCNKVLILFLFVIFVITASGCATAPKPNLEMQGLRNQVSVLELQLQEKDQQISDLKASMGATAQVRAMPGKQSAKKVISEAKSRPTPKNIQIALKNAGYNPGTIDGRMGRQTRDAIKAFQTTNNLKSDGEVGKATWSLLKEYLYKKVK